MAMTVLALADDLSVRHVEGGKKGGGAVAHIVVGHRAGPAFLERQAWLGTIQCLHLALLITAQHDGMLRRVEIQANDVSELFCETRVVGDLEASRQMRLEAMFSPD